MQFLSLFGALITSSIITLILAFLKTPAFLQMIIGTLTIISLIFFNRLLKNTFILIFLSSLFLQLLIFLTGGFFSQFLVVFHLFAITLSFLISLKVAIFFLIISTITLITGSLIDPRLSGIITSDPWPAILYILSFVILIPLYQTTVRRYHLKEAVSEILARQIRLSKIREEHIMRGVSELVFVTDTQLSILSVNDIAAATLCLSPSELVGHSLFQILFLKDKNGIIVDKKYLSIDEIINDQTIRTVDNLLLYTKNSILPKNIGIQMRPTVNPDKRVEQIIFILSKTSGFGSKEQAHTYIQPSLIRHEASLQGFKNKLKARSWSDLYIQAEILGKSEKDLLAAVEIEDHGIFAQPTLLDVSQVIQKLVLSEQDFAKGLGVSLTLDLDKQYTKDALALMPQGTTFSPAALTSRYFTAPVDLKWFNFLVQKLLDMAILLTTEEKSKKVGVYLNYNQDMIGVTVTAASSYAKDPHQLFSLNYEDVGSRTNLRLGSGLEGFLVKAITALLDIPLNIEREKNSPALSFRLELSKKSSLKPLP
ncbi:PAS domain-containing protein [Candidatus Daviesbacteria bacterium]|nr:PAS domain-containing protein [Candidatus Daviesbacteria bacterium]